MKLKIKECTENKDSQSNSRFLDNVPGAGNMLPEQAMFPVQEFGMDCLPSHFHIPSKTTKKHTKQIILLQNTYSLSAGKGYHVPQVKHIVLFV